jgi:hypothetical protein
MLNGSACCCDSVCGCVCDQVNASVSVRGRGATHSQPPYLKFSAWARQPPLTMWRFSVRLLKCMWCSFGQSRLFRACVATTKVLLHTVDQHHHRCRYHHHRRICCHGNHPQYLPWAHHNHIHRHHVTWAVSRNLTLEAHAEKHSCMVLFAMGNTRNTRNEHQQLSNARSL